MHKNKFHRGPNRSFRQSSFQNRRSQPGRFRPKSYKFGQYIDPVKFVNKADYIEAETRNSKPENLFGDFKIEDKLKNVIKNKGYLTPTPIQDKTIPHILNGNDIVGIANTGTGKTAAFLIPLINKVLLNKNEKVLIVVPTRELGIQINQELKDLTVGIKVFSVCCVGGVNIGKQISDLRYQNNFIIGTPGRLRDLTNRKKLFLSEFGLIVLDEADRMLDMGFISEVRFLMSGMKKDRQTLFFSATISPAIEKLISEFLRNPIRISVKSSHTSKNVDQNVIKIASRKKIDVLHDLLVIKDFNKVLIFGRTKHEVEKLSKVLIERGFKAESIHGNKSHSQRQRALQLFKNNVVQVLVATDVAARGLDIMDISHVINYDLPATYEDYVHRIGRTGRANKLGKALTFIE
ncbi:MAG: DEAD/DEAH box helicase [Candidatus Paceibacterota bacterium]|nr:MAG: DEAD/DEAH box helicase [Candidatus Paceibacterota bacterium]